MITIKTNAYTNEERNALDHVLRESVKVFVNKYCDPKVRCAECAYRHVCYDVLKARDYMTKLTEVTKI